MSRFVSRSFRKATARLLANRRTSPTTRLRLQDLEERTVFDVNVTATAGTVGPTNYLTLKGAFDAVNAGTHQGTITIDVVGDTSETLPAVLNASGAGSAIYSSMLIRPSGGAARTISGAITAGSPLIDLNGADNVTIDGLNSGGNALTISNTTASPTSGTATIRFIGDATSNTITNSSILGSSQMATGTNGGNIFFSTATTTGNDNNIISNNNIGPAGANLPTKLIYGNGSTTTTTIYNSGIQITGNNLFDYFNAAAQANAVYITSGNTGWTISNNKIFQTATRTHTSTGFLLAGIQVASATGNDGLTISGNTIGFANAAGTGTTNLVGTGTGSKFLGIYFSSAGATVASSIQGNTIAGINLTGVVGGTGTTAAFGAISINSGLVNIGTTTGNTIGSLTTAGSISVTSNNASAMDVRGIYYFPSATANISNNNIGGIVSTNTGAGSVLLTVLQAYTLSSFINTLQNNTIGSAAAPISNTSTATASQTIGLYSRLGASVVTGNVISNLSMNAPNVATGLLASMIGVLIDSAGATQGNNVAQNTIRNLSNSDPAAAVWVTGINYSGATAGTQTIQRNLIQNLSVASSSATATVNGINVTSGIATFQNNMIAIGANMTANSPQINGIAEVAAGTDNFYHNSVYIGGASVAAGTANSFAFNSTIVTSVRNYRDNIFFNARSNAAASGKHYAIRVGGTTASPAGLTSNNNILFANGTGGFTGLFNGADQATLANWQSATANDSVSFAVNPQYADPINAIPDIHIHPTTATGAEGNGANVGVTDDFDGQTRSSLTPVDIGADGGNFNGIDLSPPNITYTALGSTNSTSNRIITVNLTDVTGVATGALAPRVYFNKNGGAFSSIQLALQSGSVTNGTWSGSIDYALVGGVTLSDVVRYYVVAQDTGGKLTANPAPGFAGTDVNTVTSPPTTPNQFAIVPAYSGAINVGVGQTFISLTNTGGLFETINNGVLTGNVIVNIVSDLSGELGTVALNQWPEDGAGGYTMLIKPSGAARTISGISTNPAIIKLNGADRVTIDGSLSGGTDRSLTITNGNTGGTVLWIASASTSNGATNDTVKNTNISGNSGTIPISGILTGSGTTLGNDAEAPNDNNTIQNNVIFRAQNAMYVRGNTTTFDQNWAITGNIIGSTVAADKMTFRGMLIGNSKNFTISDNTFAGVTTTATTTPGTAIGVVLGIDTGTITRNRISDVKNTNAGGYGSNGIYLAASTTSSNLTISNNFISDIAAVGWTTATSVDNGYGIMIDLGGGYKLYHNSVLLNTNQGAGAATAITAALNIAAGVSTAGSIDVRDNIFDVAQTTGNRYAIYNSSTAAIFSNIDYNDYFAQNVGFQGGAQATIAAWRTATGKDVNSVAVDPLFVSTTAPADLHLQGSTPLIDAGSNVGVTTDIDGQLRDAKTDIGSDETPIPPVLASGATITYTENDAATPIAAGITVADANSTTQSTATVTITNFVSGQDVLAFTNAAGMGNIGIVSNTAGVLILSSSGATATLTQWQTALRAVTYANTSDTPNTTARNVTFVINDGYYSSNTLTSTINVTAVNDLPVPSASSVTTNEDTAKTFTLANFPFTDAEGDSLVSITVSALTLASGDTLTVDQGSGAVAVTNGMTILLAQIPTLTYTPALNANGAARSTFAFKVNDSGSGVVAATLTINVTPVNDIPVAQPSSFTTNEDITKVFAVADFQYTDIESDALVSIKVSAVTLASGDTLTVNQGSGATAVTNGMTITAAQIPSITYTPAANANGSARSTFDFLVNDTSAGVATATMTINVTAVNDVPVAGPNTVTTNEDTAKTFAVASFPFTDVEGDSLVSITVSGLALASGDTLMVDNGSGAVPVTNGMTIAAANIPTLTYLPALNANGSARSKFDFTVNDAGPGTVAATMTIDVTAVNDAPVALASSLTTNEDTAKSFAVADFLFADPESNSLVSIAVSGLTLASGDTLTVDQGSGAIAVTNGMTITAAQIPSITYTPAANANGGARSKFDFTVNDADVGTVAATMSINVTAVNDVPVALPSAVTTPEDTAKVFTVSDFTFSDVESNGLVSITVGTVTLASGDTLTVDQGSGAVPVTTGMTITAAQFATLTYTPAADTNGLARSKFDFKVNDADLGTVAATMSINVGAVNDVPVAQDSSVSTNEDTAKNFAVTDFGFTDLETNGLVAIEIVALNLASGDSLTVDQGSGDVPVTTGMTITAAQIPSLTYTPALNAYGAARTTFDFTVDDAGQGTVAATMTIDVTAVNDVPVAQPSSVSTLEDTAKTFAPSNFGYSDVETDSLVSITIGTVTLASGDTLTANLGAGTVPVTTGMTITAAQIPTLTYTPAADANGAARSSFNFTVNDAGLGTVGATMTIDVTAVNDVPVAQPSSVTALEDTAKTFTVANFNFTDLETDSLASITISSVTLTGTDTLTVNLGAGSVPVTTGMTITAAQIPTLTYTPALNANGAARGQFNFTVNDTGLGTVPATMTINVTPVNDVPVALPSNITTNQDVARVFTLADFMYTDIESDSLVSVKVSNLNLAVGDTLTVNQGAGAVAVTNGMTITAAQIPTMTYTPAPGGFGTPRSLFDFTVNDAGLGTVVATMSVNTTQLSDIQFQSPTFSVNEDGVAVMAHVVVTRTPSSGPVSVSFATSDGTAINTAVGANPQDYTATSQPLTWIAGDFTTRTIDIPINNDTLNEGRETINLALTSPTGNARLGATATAVLSIKPSDGITIDSLAKKPQGTSTDTDGDIITMKLTGKAGTLAFYRTDPDGNGLGPIELIEVAGTDPLPGKPVKAALTITAAKPKGGTGNGAVNVGAITGSTLKSITMAKTDLDGDGIDMTGFVGSVTVKDVKNGADIKLNGAAPTAKSTVKIKTGVIGDGTAIAVAAPVASLAATKIGVGTIAAPSIAKMTVSGATKPAVIVGDLASPITLTGAGLAAGKPALGSLTVGGSILAGANITAPSVGTITVKKDLNANVVLSGVGITSPKPVLKTLTVKGAVNNATIDVTGAVGAVTVGSFLTSRLFASYVGANDGSGVFTAGGDVGTFKVTGKTKAFAHSFVIASNFKSVTLASIDDDNSGTKFGVTANDVVKALTITGSKFKYDAKAGGTQAPTGTTDFQVLIK